MEAGARDGDGDEDGKEMGVEGGRRRREGII